MNTWYAAFLTTRFKIRWKIEMYMDPASLTWP
jgi:hypothetical protein